MVIFKQDTKFSIEGLKSRLAFHGISLSPDTLQKLWTYHSLLRQRNQDRDLTRILAFNQIVLIHYVDCLILSKYIQLPSPIVDVGTGAGFPGIMLKIQNPKLQITLAEPRPRRVEFLKEAIGKLRLQNIDVFDHKVTSQSFQKPMKGIITRALETIDKTILRTSGCVEVGTEYYFMKGPNCNDELKFALKEFGSWIELKKDIPYTLPKSTQKRRMIILRCIAKPEGRMKRETPQ